MKLKIGDIDYMTKEDCRLAPEHDEDLARI